MKTRCDDDGLGKYHYDKCKEKDDLKIEQQYEQLSKHAFLEQLSKEIERGCSAMDELVAQAQELGMYDTNMEHIEPDTNS